MDLIITKPIDRLKEFIADNYQTELDNYSTVDCPLIAPSLDNIQITKPNFDVRKHPDTVCFIVPNGGVIETDISDATAELNIDFYMFFANHKVDILQLQSMKHTEIFTNWILKNSDLEQSIESVEVKDFEIYIDGVEGKENLTGLQLSMTLHSFINI